MRLVGGLMGVSQFPDSLALQPECGWAIVYEDDAGSEALGRQPGRAPESETDR